MKAFFDESAMSPKDGSPVMIMAGYVGAVGDFEKSSDAWQDRLDEPPVFPYFHYREGFGTDRIPALAQSIGNQLQGFIITIPHAPFTNRNAKIAKGLLGTRIYDWAFIHTVKAVLQWVDENFPEGEKVDFIFEKRSELELCRKELYDKLAAEGLGFWRRAGTCTPEEDKKVAALQMGDLLAGEYLASIRAQAISPGLADLARIRKIFLLHKEPHQVIQRSLTLHSLGKKMFDAGRKKILACPPDSVDPAVYEKEYLTLQAISAIAMQDSEMLRKETEQLHESTSQQSRVQSDDTSSTNNS